MQGSQTPECEFFTSNENLRELCRRRRREGASRVRERAVGRGRGFPGWADVMIGVGYSGWRNSRCMPRPTYCSLSMEPPQVEPAMATCTGSGQNSGWPEMRASLPPKQHGGVAVVHGLNFEDGGGRKIVEKDAAFDFRLDDAAVHFVSQVGVRVKHADARE